MGGEAREGESGGFGGGGGGVEGVLVHHYAYVKHRVSKSLGI